MRDPIVSSSAFYTFLTVCISLGIFWVFVDIVHLSRLRGNDFREPVNRDKRFGYSLGVVIGVFTTVGLLRFHGVL